MKKTLKHAIKILQEQFPKYSWPYNNPKNIGIKDIAYDWPGDLKEEIMICMHKSHGEDEDFHRHGFFFFNYAYRHDYEALCYDYNNRITIKEGECYIGQPNSGYALCSNNDDDILIMGVLIQKNSVYKTLLPILASNSQLFEFFFKPKKNIKSEEYIHLKFPKNSPVKALLNIMIMEYAYKTEDTQDILKPLVVALLMNVAREYKLQNPVRENISLSKKMVQYINEKLSNASLKGLSKQFKYHPNYICSLLHKETGKTFSQLLLELRMQRAETLLTQTFLPIEEIALSLGYSDSSNFYKVFKSFYKCSPREFVRKQRNK